MYFHGSVAQAFKLYKFITGPTQAFIPFPVTCPCADLCARVRGTLQRFKLAWPGFKAQLSCLCTDTITFSHNMVKRSILHKATEKELMDCRETQLLSFDEQREHLAYLEIYH